MTDLKPAAGKQQRSAPLHPSIGETQVSMLVEQFYQRVHGNELLGPVFATQTTEDWPLHLEKMKTFWRSVLLKTGEYKGKPVPVHQRLEGVSTQHFEEWLRLFAETSHEVFSTEAAQLVNSAARNIATSLWLSRAKDPFATPPVWTDSDPNMHSMKLMESEV